MIAHADRPEGDWYAAYLAASKEARELRVKLAKAEGRAARAEARCSNLLNSIAGSAKVLEDGMRIDEMILQQFDEAGS